MRGLAIIMAIGLFVAPISDVWASGSNWHFSQARMRRAYVKSLRQQAQFWKKFDAEMDQLKTGFDGEKRDSNSRVNRPTKRCK